MKVAIRFIAVLAFLSIAGCSWSARGDRKPASRVYSPSELNASPINFDRQEIMIEGFVLLSSNSHSFYESKELFEEFDRRLRSEKNFRPEEYNKYCLTIANPDMLWRKPERYKGKTLIFRGEFIKDYLSENVIDLGACANPTAIIIKSLRAQDQSSGHPPSR